MFAIIAAALAALACGFLGHLGYLGGPIYADFPRTAHAPPPRGAIVLLSGDMGLTMGMGHDVAKRLADDGFAVTGVNSLAFFRVRRTPAQASAMLAQAVARAEASAHVDHVMLVGQSFGADLMHVALAAAPPALRAQIRFVGLIVPEDSVDYRASPSEIFSSARPDAQAWPTARLLDWVPVACIQGAQEAASLCPLMAAMPNVSRIVLPGGHPVHRDDAAVHRALLHAIDAASGRTAS